MTILASSDDDDNENNRDSLIRL